jgi:hypothetical protein
MSTRALETHGEVQQLVLQPKQQNHCEPSNGFPPPPNWKLATTIGRWMSNLSLLFLRARRCEVTMWKSHTRSLFSNMDSDPICLDETVSDFPHVFVLCHFRLLPARHRFSDLGRGSVACGQETDCSLVKWSGNSEFFRLSKTKPWETRDVELPKPNFKRHEI